VQSLDGRSIERVYAQTIAAEPALAIRRHFVIPRHDDMSRSALERTTARLSRKAERERELCGLSAAQHRVLRARFALQTRRVQLPSRLQSTEPVSVSETDLSRREIEQALAAAGLPNIHCRTFEAYEHILLLLSAHLS
jgi:hypothetical protein